MDDALMSSEVEALGDRLQASEGRCRGLEQQAAAGAQGVAFIVSRIQISWAVWAV